METLTPIERAVLDATSRVPENLEQIYQHLHAPPAAVPLAEAADAVWSLVRKGLIEPTSPERPPSDDPSVVWRSRLAATPRGRETLAGIPGQAWPKGQRATLGMFQGLAPGVPFEVFKENRREMSGKYAEGVMDE
jgi:hypothetical protein